MCNGCRNTLSQENIERYVCLSCRRDIYLSGGYIDFCSECIKIMCENKEEMVRIQSRSDQIVENWSRNKFFKGHKFKVEHKHEEHIYLMMPYQIKAYDENQYLFF